MTKDPRQLPSLLLVALQFGLLAVLAALAVPALLVLAIPMLAWVLAAGAVLLAVWALGTNRLGNFNIRPIPKTGGVLVTQGPYRWMRHPMYSAFLLGAAALAWTAGLLLAWVAWCVLLGVLVFKATLEERWMREQHAGYAAYSAQTRRFIPWLF